MNSVLKLVNTLILHIKKPWSVIIINYILKPSRIAYIDARPEQLKKKVTIETRCKRNMVPTDNATRNKSSASRSL